MKQKFITLEGLIYLVIFIIVMLATWFGIDYQFEIYQKKYGDKMTFMEFLCDSGK